MLGWFTKTKNIKLKGKDGKEQKTLKLSEKQVKEKEEYIKNLIGKTHLPLVILDNEWYKVKTIIGNAEMEAKEEKLKELLKEQGNLVNEIKKDDVVKHNFMQDVLRVSEVVNTAKTDAIEKELEKLHQGIVKINQQINEKESRLDEVDANMKQLNLELIEEAVAIGYEGMEIYKVQSTALEEEIDALREEVLKKTNEKKVFDEYTNILYQYLHNMIGYEHIDKVDKVLEEGKNSD